MGLSKLQQKRTDGVSFIDHRSGLYYSKYQYRARVYINGVTIIWWCDNEQDIHDKISKHKQRWRNCDVQQCVNFLNWKNSLPPKDKSYSIRIEGSTASIFSNDLAFLNNLETLGFNTDITEVDSSIPEGVKYFKEEPKYKYRLYFKSKVVPEDYHKKVRSFLERYKDTSTVIVPSRALKNWAYADGKRGWATRYSSSHYFINYNDESVTSLFMLMFDGMVSKRFKLEKRPD